MTHNHRGIILGVPNDWRHDGGEPESTKKCLYSFTCIGEGCWSMTSDWDGRKANHTSWKCAGTPRAGYRGRNGEWQGMCKACFDGGRGIRTTASIEDVHKRLECISTTSSIEAKAVHQSQSLPRPAKPQPPTIITKFMMVAKLISLSVVTVVIVVGALKLFGLWGTSNSTCSCCPEV